MVDFDVVIIGGGIVGLATACALKQTKMNIAVIDAKHDLYQELAENEVKIRASAINLASKHYFEQIGIWSVLERSGRVLAFDSIDVTERQGFARLSANSASFHYDQLGYIIENQLMQNTLYQCANTQSNITFFHQPVNDLFFSSDRGFVELSDGSKVAAKLVIAADGANSLIRKKQGMTFLKKPYRHQAIIATVKTQFAHQSCARQVFYADGIIALLPLWQSHLSCLVWSTKPQFASDLLIRPPHLFNQQLSELTEHCLGDCSLVSERELFPLVARYCPKPVQDRLILIGDAAHTIHPLAGQGVNLGLQDSKQLVDVIIKNYLAHKDFGLKRIFNHYQFMRHKDTMMMLTAMQTIQDTFDGASPIKKLARGIGMNMINTTPFIKQHLVKYALGL